MIFFLAPKFLHEIYQNIETASKDLSRKGKSVFQKTNILDPIEKKNWVFEIRLIFWWNTPHFVALEKVGSQSGVSFLIWLSLPENKSKILWQKKIFFFSIFFFFSVYFFLHWKKFFQYIFFYTGKIFSSVFFFILEKFFPVYFFLYWKNFFQCIFFFFKNTHKKM